MREKRKKKPARTNSASGRTRKTTSITLSQGPAEGAPGGTGQNAAFGRRKRVTIADIARHAGVSPAAVSITLADRRDISLLESTRDRIKRSAEALGYFPSRLGKGFLRGRSKLVGIQVVADSHSAFLECMDGIQEGLAAADYISLVLTANWLCGYVKGNLATNREDLDELPDLRRLLEYQVEGVIYFSTNAAHTAAFVGELVNRKVPTVVLGGVEPCMSAVDVVGGDNATVGRMAAEHLLSVGCASFAFGKAAFSHPLEDIVRSSFISRLREAGYACGDFTVDTDYPSDLNHVLSRLIRPPAGVFVVRDEVAALTLRAALSLGWRVPRDFAVAGMGQTTLPRFSLLPITTVSRNSFDAGKKAAKLLVRRIEGFDGRPQRILIQPSLEARQSTVSDVSWRLCPADSGEGDIAEV